MSRKSLSVLCGLGLIVILLIVIFNLGIAPVKDSQIKDDLMCNDSILNCFYSDYVQESEYELKKYELVKRQTNKDVKEDNVFCSIEIENDYFNIMLDLQLYYVYYDKGGWFLEDVLINNQVCKAISGPDMDMVLEYIKSKQPHQIYNYIYAQENDELTEQQYQGEWFIVENDSLEGVAHYGELSYKDSSYDENTATLTVIYESPVLDIWGDYTLDFYSETGQYSGWVLRCYEEGFYEGYPAFDENYSLFMKYNSVALGDYSGIIIKEIDNRGVLIDSPINGIYDAWLDFNPITGSFTLSCYDFDLTKIKLNGYDFWWATYKYDPIEDVWDCGIDQINLVRQ